MSGRMMVGCMGEVPCPCKGCPLRAVGCHDGCEDYENFVERKGKVNEKIRKERLLEQWGKPARKAYRGRR